MLNSVHLVNDVATDDRAQPGQEAEQPEALSDEQLQNIAGGPTMGSNGSGN